VQPNLLKYGLDETRLQESLQYGDLCIARVIEQQRDRYKVISETGELNAVISGKLRFQALGLTGYPAVGDFVMIDKQESQSGDSVIHHILSRKSLITRKAPGTTLEQQVIAANVDTLLICTSLNADFNLRRLERYLTIAWESQATPVIVLTKSDLSVNAQTSIDEIATVAFGVDIQLCSTITAGGLNELESIISPGKTYAFVGSSGVGKSTIINHLAGVEILAVGDIRQSDSRGRHTTTHRQLILLPSGAIVIDTPGMRELSIVTGDLSNTFADIDELSRLCKYKDCSHNSEPGCAVLQAVELGTLSAERLKSWQKLELELSYSELNSRELENAKIDRMFGGKGEMKQAMKYLKQKNKR
jgi:ribosome biogenesis GTPase